VLLVGENQTNQRLLSHYLTSWQANPITIGGWQSNGQVNAAKVDALLVDLVLADDAELNLLTEWQNSDPGLPIIGLLPLGKRLPAPPTVQNLTTVLKPIRPAAVYQALATMIDGRTQLKQETEPGQKFDPTLGRRYPLRILLAEDNGVNQKVALGILKKLGYQADVAANGLEVLAALDRQPYDLVFMDIQMPEMDGVDATHRIRQRWPATKQPTIVSMTANAFTEDQERYLAAGMHDHLSKPIQLDELVRVLSHVKPLKEGKK
jgi:CheY-like chemotaxis protein